MLWIACWGDLLAAFQYKKGVYESKGDRLFTRVCSDRARDKGFKLKEGRSYLHVRKTSFYNEGSETLEEVT